MQRRIQRAGIGTGHGQRVAVVAMHCSAGQ